ncbi:D-allulose-6-phosphate 3-epimerase [Cypionkella aquatica]|uniref:D-allulose-6-phosphate 3-epimerase n=1 Tax=Cypionkella aquatica TaxID=1756042 RepID=A0AA37TUX7_9RHOB|nr:ribulose-phosphate 3-epimerase [Cypionkella aquatica]GLS88168.1 D-allulose-6-phosphate 3-epimerase [Cypionkella aquatica]
MPRPPSDWINALPRSRLLAEYSMWSANLIRLADDLERISPHADILHIDVADGHFAPALLFFPDLVAGLRGLTSIPIHVHLMVDDAVLIAQIDQFAEAGADLISVHVENANAAEGLQRIGAHGLKAGMVLRVETPVDKAAKWVAQLDMLTLLGTAIGVKGQGLDPTAGARLGEAGALIAASGKRVILAADGGIRDTTVPLLREAGAETVVMGSLAFGAPDLAERMAWLHAL